MLGGWVNPHREQQTIPQGQTSIPHSHSGIDEKRPTENFVNPVCVLLLCLLHVAVCSTSLVCAVSSVSKTLAP